MQASNAPSANLSQLGQPPSTEAPAPTNGIKLPRWAASSNPGGMGGIGRISLAIDNLVRFRGNECGYICMPWFHQTLRTPRGPFHELASAMSPRQQIIHEYAPLVASGRVESPIGLPVNGPGSIMANGTSPMLRIERVQFIDRLLLELPNDCRSPPSGDRTPSPAPVSRKREFWQY